MKTKILIELQGGYINKIISTDPNIDISILDFDFSPVVEQKECILGEMVIKEHSELESYIADKVNKD